jgi:uncharacterized protein (TIGR03437 family)
MSLRTGNTGILFIWLAGSAAFAQTMNNQSLSGKYFFRHVSVATTPKAGILSALSLIGTMTFDGSGHYSYAGQAVVGSGSPTAITGTGTYSIAPAGFVAMDNPLRPGDPVNARIGPEALVGSSTEATDGSFDMLVAIPAPTSGNAKLSGSYWMVTLEFPNGSSDNVRNTFFNMNVGALGQIGAFSVTGHAANLFEGVIQVQNMTGASSLMASDGTGSINFGGADPTLLVSGTRTLYASADGAVLLGGSPGSHDFLIGVAAAPSPSPSTWNGTFWGAGLRYDLTDADVESYAGAAAARGAGSLTWTKRLKTLSLGAIDFTAVNPYTFQNDTSATVELGHAGLGVGSKAFVGSVVQDQNGYEIYFGALAPTLSGTGIFLNPQMVLNAASFAPAGNPISPGEFISLFGTGLAASAGAAPTPYPSTFNGVTVLINGKPAPLDYVSPKQINCLVPYSTTGATATVVVQSGGQSSNTVTVPVAATSPGIYTQDQSGGGPAAVLHADYSLVTPSKPALPGETVAIFLTGMGAVSPSVADGTAGKASPLSQTPAMPTVLVAGQPATAAFSGLAPGYPGLYQLNITLPSTFNFPGNLPLALQTSNAYHDQVLIPVQ